MRVEKIPQDFPINSRKSIPSRFWKSFQGTPESSVFCSAAQSLEMQSGPAQDVVVGSCYPRGKGWLPHTGWIAGRGCFTEGETESQPVGSTLNPVMSQISEGLSNHCGQELSKFHLRQARSVHEQVSLEITVPACELLQACSI